MVVGQLIQQFLVLLEDALHAVDEDRQLINEHSMGFRVPYIYLSWQ